jgi:signal transduction histidine kinase
VRSRLLLLVVLPTLAAMTLGAVSVASSARSAVAYQRVERFSQLGGQIANLIQALQAEREDTIRYLTMGPSGGGRGAPGAAATPELAVLAKDHRATDQLAVRVQTGAAGIGAAYPVVTQQEAKGAITAINGLSALRSEATSSQIPSLVVIQEYASLINQLLALEGETATGSNDAALADTVRAVGLISASKEQVSQEQAILISALTPDLVGATQFQPSQLSSINAALAEQQADLAQFGLIATSAERHRFNSTLSSAQATHAQAQVQQAITLAQSGGSRAANPAFTNAASGSAYLVASLHSVEQRFMSSIIGQSSTLRTKAITTALIEAFAVLAVLGLALLFTTAVGRSMTRPLRRLRTGALEVAGSRLPETVRLMSRGGANAPPEIKPIDVDSTDEIGEVARAFDQVHREALRLAANEAALRGNVNAMFVNLSRRSQSLVERQIRLIDDLEQGEQDPERLSNLFQMDHLATRMRRNSENLLVLAGHDLSRRWTEPVTLVDVLRAAVSEIEHYERVTPHIQPGISVRGTAVSDVVHLLSELVENATAFSPEETLVKVSGYVLNSGGVLLDISDQGVGMGAEEMAHANWRLDNPPVVDVAVSRRMGLFVVARLAARHGIRVRLRPAPTGGLTALVWLPDEVVTRETLSSTLGLRRFRPDVNGSAVSWLDNGLAVSGPGGRPAATRAVPAARRPRHQPQEPEPDKEGGDGAADAGISSEGNAVVTVASVSPAPAAPVIPSPAESGDPPVIVPPAGTRPENRLPIFEAVESDWFRRGRHSVDWSTPVPESAPASWPSPSDEGWRAAEVAQAPVSAGFTSVGLPKRVPNANLVPGGVAPPAAAPPSLPARSAEQTRQRLASFQQGIRKARVADPDDEPSTSKEDT